MQEAPKNKEALEKNSSDSKSDDATWGEDQEKREYYYDDAHGYEVFVPEEDAKDAKGCNSE